jgi:hypothetical protein
VTRQPQKNLIYLWNCAILVDAPVNYSAGSRRLQENFQIANTINKSGHRLCPSWWKINKLRILHGCFAVSFVTDNTYTLNLEQLLKES